MPQEFFDYVKRDNEQAPDWASVGATISDDLTTISEERQAKRAEIEQSTQKAVDALNQQEMGANQTLNQMIMDGSRQSTNYLLQQDKLMKANKIKPEQYMISKQAQLDDWNTLSGTVKGWNADYDEYKARMEDGTSAGMERSMAEWNEEFGNVSNKSIVVNPTNGRLYMTTRNEDGSVNTDPDKMVTVNALNNRLKDRVEKYDLNGQVQNQVDQLGQIVKVINKDGIMTMDDIRQNKEFLAAEDKMVTALMNTPRNVSSILSDYVGGYGFTQDPKLKGQKDEAGNEMILLVPDKNGLYQPEFTTDQSDAARDHVKMQLEMQLGHKETPKAARQGRQSTQADRNARTKKKEESYLYQTAVDVAKGEEAAVQRVVRDTDVSNIVLDEGTNEWVVQFDDQARADERYASSGDSETDALWLFNYTVGDNFASQYGSTSAESARRSWSGQGGASTTALGERQGIEQTSVSDINLSTGERLYDEVNRVLLDKDLSLSDQVRDMNDIVGRMVLPKGMTAKDIDIYKSGGKLHIKSDALGIAESYSVNQAADGVMDSLQNIIDAAVEQYNTSTQASSGGSSAGDDIFNP